MTAKRVGELDIAPIGSLKIGRQSADLGMVLLAGSGYPQGKQVLQSS